MKPLHLVTSSKDSFKERFEYIQFKDGKFIATDAHILIISPQNEVLPEYIYEKLPNECYFLNSDWKNSKIDKAFYFKIDNNIIECLDNKFKTLGFLRFITKEDYENKFGIYPDVNKAIPDCSEAKEKISFNPALLNNLYLANNKTKIQLDFSSGNRGIRVKFENSEAKGLIMPIINSI